MPGHGQSGQIDSEKPAPINRRGGGEDEEDDRQRQDGVEPLVLEFDLVEQPYRSLSQGDSDQCPQSHLPDEQNDEVESIGFDIDNQLAETNGEENRHRIVGARLQLEQRTDPAPQGDAPGTEDRKDCGGIG
jgi:hypothetical protein